MKAEEALDNFKRLTDAAIKAGLFPTLEDAAIFYQSYIYIKNNLCDPDNNKQQKPVVHSTETSAGLETAELS